MDNYVGTLCALCKTEFKEQDEIVVCNSCDMPHHKACWTENQGCATFGCMVTTSSPEGSSYTVTIKGTSYDNTASSPPTLCPNCGAQKTSAFAICDKCGNSSIASSSAAVYRQTNNASVGSRLRTASIVLTILAVILWCAAPFAAINLLTLDNQPTACEVFSDTGISYLGNLKESDAYIASVVSLVALIGCVVGWRINKGYRLTMAVSFVSELILMYMASGISSGRLEKLFGIGYWGIMAVLFVLFLLSIAQYVVESCNISAPSKTAVVVAPVNSTPSSKPVPPPPPVVTRPRPAEVFCPQCGKKQAANREVCFFCETPFTDRAPQAADSSAPQMEVDSTENRCPKCQGKLTFNGTYCAACGEFIN